MFVFSQFTGSDWGIFFYLVAFANGLVLFGSRYGVLYLAAILPVAIADVTLARTQGIGVGEAALSILPLVPLALFIVGVYAAALSEKRGRQRIQALLEELAETHAELEEAHGELRSYAERVRALAISEERARIAREIHDTLGHHLTAAKLQLEHARKAGTRRPQEARDEVGEAQQLILAALSAPSGR